MKRIAPVLASLLFLAAASGMAASATQKLDYPVAPRDRIVTDYFGTQVPAPYRWMERTCRAPPCTAGWTRRTG